MREELGQEVMIVGNPRSSESEGTNCTGLWIVGGRRNEEGEGDVSIAELGIVGDRRQIRLQNRGTPRTGRGCDIGM